MSMSKVKGGLDPETILTLNTWAELKDNFEFGQVQKALYWAAKNRGYHKKASMKRQATVEQAKAVLEEARKRGIVIETE